MIDYFSGIKKKQLTYKEFRFFHPFCAEFICNLSFPTEFFVDFHFASKTFSYSEAKGVSNDLQQRKNIFFKKQKKKTFSSNIIKS